MASQAAQLQLPTRCCCTCAVQRGGAQRGAV